MGPKIQAKTEVLERDFVKVLSMKGEIDLSNCDEIVGVFTLNCEPNQKWVFDLTETSYIDSEGIKAILICVAEIKRNQSEVILAYERGVVERVLKFTSLHSVIDCYLGLGSAFDNYNSKKI